MSDFHLEAACDTKARRVTDLGERITRKNDEATMEKRRAAEAVRDRAAHQVRVKQDPELGDPFDQEHHKFIGALTLVLWTLVAYFIGAGLERQGASQLFQSFTNRTVGTVCAWLFPVALIVAEYIIGRRLSLAVRAFRHRRHGSTVEFWNALKWGVAAVVAVIIPLYLVLSPYWAAGFGRQYTLFLWFQVLLTLSVHSITIALGNGVSQTAKWLVVQWRDRRYGATIHAAEQSYERHCTEATNMAQETVTLLRDGQKAGCHLDFPPLDEDAWQFLLIDCSCAFVRPWYHQPADDLLPLLTQGPVPPESGQTATVANLVGSRPTSNESEETTVQAHRLQAVPDYRPSHGPAQPEVIDVEVIGHSQVPPDYKPRHSSQGDPANDVAAGNHAAVPPEYRPGAAA